MYSKIIERYRPACFKPFVNRTVFLKQNNCVSPSPIFFFLGIMSTPDEVSGTDSELIVYLEPSDECALLKSMNAFLKNDQYMFTTAGRYSCHCSMTGFFHCPNAVDTQSTLGDCIKKGMGQVKLLPALIAKETPHLLLPVEAPRHYRAAIEMFAHKMWSQFGIKVRPKRIDHISLAYFDETHGQQGWLEAVHNGLLTDMKESAMKSIPISGQTNWDVVLLRRTHKAVNQGEKHQFVELARWNNVDRSS